MHSSMEQIDEKHQCFSHIARSGRWRIGCLADTGFRQNKVGG